MFTSAWRKALAPTPASECARAGVKPGETGAERAVRLVMAEYGLARAWSEGKCMDGENEIPPDPPLVPWPFVMDFPFPEAPGDDSARRTIRIRPNPASTLRLPVPSYFRGIYAPAATSSSSSSSAAASSQSRDFEGIDYFQFTSVFPLSHETPKPASCEDLEYEMGAILDERWRGGGAFFFCCIFLFLFLLRATSTFLLIDLVSARAFGEVARLRSKLEPVGAARFAGNAGRDVRALGSVPRTSARRCARSAASAHQTRTHLCCHHQRKTEHWAGEESGCCGCE